MIDVTEEQIVNELQLLNHYKKLYHTEKKISKNRRWSFCEIQMHHSVIVISIILEEKESFNDQSNMILLKSKSLQNWNKTVELRKP